MAGETKITKTIASLKRLGNSVNGNPRWQVTCTDGTKLGTETDGQVGYAIDNPEYRNVPVTFTLTRHGLIRYADVAS